MKRVEKFRHFIVSLLVGPFFCIKRSGPSFLWGFLQGRDDDTTWRVFCVIILIYASQQEFYCKKGKTLVYGQAKVLPSVNGNQTRFLFLREGLSW